MNHDSAFRNTAGGILVMAIPFLVGVGYRIDLALVFCVVSFVYFLLVPLILQPLREFMNEKWLHACALVVCGGLGGMFDVMIAWLVPGLWKELHVFVPLLGASPLLIHSLFSESSGGSTMVTGAVKQWGTLSALVIVAAAGREFLATGGVSVFFGPGLDASFRVIPEGWFSLPVLLMVPAVFFLAGLYFMWVQRGASPGGTAGNRETES